ncbi:MAG: DegV family protein [Firmicutes bacterium]|jgi:DegV family protein with EDD domain|nr:DegV family protein [Bacillota bacterium]
MIKIVTDSIADLPREYIEKYAITVLPLNINIGNNTFLDGINISPAQVCDYMQKGEIPKTSQVPPIKFYNAFEELTRNGDEVIAILMSSQLSSTYNSAVLSRNQLPDRKIAVLDSKGVSLGQGLQVIEAARMAAAGKMFEEITKRVKILSQKMTYAIIINTLEYVFRGGRISKAQYIAGNLLHLNLVCSSDGNGKIIIADKFRGKERSILRWVSQHIPRLNLNSKTVGINMINNEKLLQEVKALIQKHKPREIIESHIGSTVACYAGPNAIGIFAEK